MHEFDYGFEATLSGSFDEVLDRVAGALKEEGFGVLTKIDVADTLKKKLGVKFRQYAILGACNPVLAKQALRARTKARCPSRSWRRGPCSRWSMILPSSRWSKKWTPAFGGSSAVCRTER